MRESYGEQVVDRNEEMGYDEKIDRERRKRSECGCFDGNIQGGNEKGYDVWEGSVMGWSEEDEK